MIVDLLNRKIKEMKELRRLESIKANKAQQEATDLKYQAFVKEMHQAIDAIYYADKELGFIVSTGTKIQINGMLAATQEVTKSGFADKELLASAQTALKNVQNAIKKEWSSHFTHITSTTTSTLKAINAIDTEKVGKCLSNIKSAEIWGDDKDRLSNLKDALSEAKTLIQSLNLDDGIISFLTKMNTGQATIDDLNEVVLEWIRQEGLESRIRLKFS
ncbi:hypothetical protein HNQ43_000056 [Faecalicoccus acidiformans]|uniref:Uncharacterized protein n=1 Tax=Faecalicoccus acidiformans TaxID=915173 RepID=A0A7W8D0V1_9FIRM|nr:hypothetical protein [Faecalicoccus acidiformans]MBB5184023.1 hypothetical protein [Faecalicoccus acidiformans]